MTPAGLPGGSPDGLPHDEHPTGGYDAPAVDPGSVSALAASLHRHAARLEADLLALRSGPTSPEVTRLLDELEGVRAVLPSLAAALQEHATTPYGPRLVAATTRAREALHASWPA